MTMEEMLSVDEIFIWPSDEGISFEKKYDNVTFEGIGSILRITSDFPGWKQVHEIDTSSDEIILEKETNNKGDKTWLNVRFKDGDYDPEAGF